jgi:hypothetical protein
MQLFFEEILKRLILTCADPELVSGDSAPDRFNIVKLMLAQTIILSIKNACNFKKNLLFYK